MTVKININYLNPEPKILEIQFLRGKTLLHNVFYDIEGLCDKELIELKKEAVSKFCAVFPTIPKKAILKGFAEVDPMMESLYTSLYNPRGAGNKKGSKRTSNPAKRRTIRLSDAHYAAFIEKGGCARLRQLLEDGSF